MFKRVIKSGTAYWIDIFKGSMIVNDDTLEFLVKPETRFALHIKGASDLHRDKLLRPLTKLILKVLMAQPVGKERTYDTVEYVSSKSKDTIASILKCRKYSNETKVAAILGVMAFVPDMPFDKLQKYVQDQINPKNVEGMTFDKNCRFLHPDFALNFADRNRLRNVQITSEEYENFVSIASFLANSDKEETFSQYFRRAQYGRLIPDLSTSRNSIYAQIAFEEVCQSRDPEKTKRVFADSTATDITRFYELNQDTYPPLRSFFLRRLSENTMLYENDFLNEDLKIYSSYKFAYDAPGLARYLTIEEHEELLTQIVEDLDKQLWTYLIDSDNDSADLISYYFLTAGFAKVRELALLMHTKPEYSSLQLYDSYKNNSSRNIVRELLLAIEPDLVNYPLEWAIQMTNPDASSDITNQLVR